MRELGLNGHISHGGRWLTLPGDRFPVYVVESSRGGYFTWCDDPGERAVIHLRHALEAIEVGLRRAADHRV